MFKVSLSSAWPGTIAAIIRTANQCLTSGFPSLQWNSSKYDLVTERLVKGYKLTKFYNNRAAVVALLNYLSDINL
jgi:hypothetical protein